ncbi:MAG TPA: hypothetical protein VFQ53_02020 [Kofleriaceae bacterium]|nr:hypothetical protein [Kofleriaceae bacterium]
MSVRLRVPAVDDPDFVADVAHGEIAVLRLSGSADSAATEPLAGLLAEVHDDVRARGTREVVVDLCAVERINAACVKQLVAWIARLQELAPEQRYRIRFRFNPAIAWQEPTVGALCCFDTELVAAEP